MLIPFKILRQYERAVGFRLGRFIGLRGPGLTVWVPIADDMRRVDLREAFVEIPRQNAITKDNAPIEIIPHLLQSDGRSRRKERPLQDFRALSGIAATSLRRRHRRYPRRRSGQRDQIGGPPRQAGRGHGTGASDHRRGDRNHPACRHPAGMNRQMAAERERRAVVLRRKKRQASITVAEGEKAPLFKGRR